MAKKTLMTRDRANKINWRRRDREHNEVFPAMFTDLKSLKLKRVDTRTGDRNNHESNKINENSFYLVGYNGNWFISKARRDYHDRGWEFDLKHYSMGLGMIDFLFEIKNVPEYKSDPLGRVEADFDEYGDRIYDKE